MSGFDSDKHAESDKESRYTEGSVHKKETKQTVGGLVVLEQNTEGEGFKGGDPLLKEKKRATRKSERMRVNAELSKLSNTLKFETEQHKIHQEELIKQRTAEIKTSFQVKTDHLYLLKQESKSESYNVAVITADRELKKIENSSLRDEMKNRLVSRVMETLDQTLAALDN
ncbi:MAG: hypothetical protein KAG19_08620 [Methylococcales bacterium]|nr:hypothetical protein [Methylococcales bacterium]